MKRKQLWIVLFCVIFFFGTTAAWAEDTTKYSNPVLGYQLFYPSDMQVDTDLGDVCTIFRNNECQIEVYYQPLKNSSYLSYVNYSNGGFIKNRVDHQNIWTGKQTINGRTVSITKWNRTALKKIEHDFNFYYTADIRKSATEAYSLFFKSSRDISGDPKYMNVLKSFQCTEVKGEKKYVTFQESEQQAKERTDRLNLETKLLLQQYFGENAPLTWGIFEPTAPSDLSKLMKLEVQMGQRFKFLLYYHHLFGKVPIETVAKELQNAYKNGYIVELTLQTGDYNEDNAMYDILNGEYDSYFTRYAQTVAKFEHPVLLRFANEMNGDWCIYSAYHTGKDTEIYKKCYRYIHDIFEQNGANNVLWIWNPNEKSFPNFTWNAMEMYYPGNAYVDLIGMTGYNTGTYYNGENWRSFNAIYQKMYQTYQKMFQQPLMITEFASSSIGGDKSAWIADMFQQLPNYPAIKVAIWWNGCDWAVPGKVPARPYWVNETEQTLQQFKEGWAVQTAALQEKKETEAMNAEQSSQTAGNAFIVQTMQETRKNQAILEMTENEEEKTFECSDVDE